MNPYRYVIIYNSKYNGYNDNVFYSPMGTTGDASMSSSPYASPHSHSFTKPYQNYYYNEYHEGILEIANSFLKILTNQMMDIAMVAVAVKADVKEE
jgi:hypothetical protein